MNRAKKISCCVIYSLWRDFTNSNIPGIHNDLADDSSSKYQPISNTPFSLPQTGLAFPELRPRRHVYETLQTTAPPIPLCHPFRSQKPYYESHLTCSTFHLRPLISATTHMQILIGFPEPKEFSSLSHASRNYEDTAEATMTTAEAIRKLISNKHIMKRTAEATNTAETTKRTAKEKKITAEEDKATKQTTKSTAEK